MKLTFEKKPGLPRPATNLKGHLICLGVASGLIAIHTAATAATLQVKPGGAGGAYSTIGAAVTRAQADYTDSGTVDVIQVAPGTYMEAVKIETPLSLVGAGSGRSIINAT